VSEFGDPHARAVIEALVTQGDSTELLDLSEFPPRLALSMTFEDGARQFSLKRDSGGRLDLATVGAVGWRRPQPFALASQQSLERAAQPLTCCGLFTTRYTTSWILTVNAECYWIEASNPFGKLIIKVQVRWMIGPGFLGSGLALFHLTTLNLQIDFKSVMMYCVYRSMSLALLFLPISTVAYAGVPAENSGDVSEMINLFRNICTDRTTA
jgi:hypothetical protein